MTRLPQSPARAEDVLTWARDLQRAVRAMRPVAGPGILVSEGSGGTVISARPGGRGGSDDSHPFQVVTRQKPDQPNIVQAGVVYESSLYKSLRPNDTQPITGLLNAQKTSGWFDLQPNDLIWLEVEFGSTIHTVEGADIQSSGMGDSFDPTANAWVQGAYVEPADVSQSTSPIKYARKIIAKVEPVNGKPTVTQCMFSHQLLRHCCIDGRGARYPFAHDGVTG